MDAEEKQYGQFLIALCTEFATEDRPLRNRQLAGIHIKNLIHSRDADAYNVKKLRWEQCPEDTKYQARAAFMQALNSPHVTVSHTSAQVLAAYGAVDIPAGRFPELLTSLCDNVRNSAAPEMTKTSSLEAIGYMCEQLDSSDVEPGSVNKMLTAIIAGMEATMSNPIRRAATEALKNTVDLACDNFESEGERGMIMASIKASATMCDDEKVREEAYDCLVVVGELYYHLLADYIMDIFMYTTHAIKTEDDDVGKKAIEFWLQVCEEEVDRNDRIESGEKDVGHFMLMKRAFPDLLPIIMEHTLNKQADDVDDDSWNMYQAGCEFIKMLALCVRDDMMPIVVPFITTNISSADWRQKEAAVSVFGFIMDGPSAEKLHPLIGQAVPMLLALTQETNDHVALASLWTMAQICEFHTAAINTNQLEPLVQNVMTALDRESPMLVEKGCQVVINIALACEEQADHDTNLLSFFFMPLMQKLLTVAQRPDLLDTNAVHALYEAALNLIMFSAADMNQYVKSILLECLTRLELCINPATNMPLQEKHKLQGSLCGIIGVCIEKYQPEDVTEEVADRLMTALLTVVKDTTSSTVSEGFYAICKLTTVMESAFARYVEYLMPFVFAALDNFEDKSSCTHVIAILGDLYRALSPAEGEVATAPHPMAQFSDDIMRRVLTLLQSNSAPKTLKPEAISLFSDVVLALKKDFHRYSDSVMTMLDNASRTELSANEEDEEHDEFVWELREKIVEVYAAIFIAFREDKVQETIYHFVPTILTFALNWCAHSNHTEDVLKHTVALLGDLVEAYGAKVSRDLVNHEGVKKVIQAAQSADSEEIRQYAKWTYDIIYRPR